MDVCAIYGFCVGGKSFHYSNPSLAQKYIHFYELILLVRLPYVIGELFSKWYETHVSNNNSNFTAAICRDAVFHTIPTPTVSYSVPSIVEVSGGCQSVNIICLRQRGITI